MKLISVTQENWMDIASLSVKEHQKGYVAPAIGILARGYVYRDCNGKVYAFEKDGMIVGTALVREFTEEPLGYDLQQFMIDGRYQGRGFGTEALPLILEELAGERKYPCAEVCVKKDNAAALHVFEKLGFADTGYIDPDAPDCRNLMHHFA